MLGIDPESSYEEIAVQLIGASTLTMVSDGVAEATSTTGQPAREIAKAAMAWGQNDDITVVTVRRTA